MTRPTPPLDDVKAFWESNPLCARAIGETPGTPAFFEKYDRERERIESPAFASTLHAYAAFRERRVLEVGCGNGYTLARYARHGAHVHGIDLTTAAIDICRARFRQFGLEGDFQTGNAEALPYESNAFDCICSMGVLHHVPSPDRAIAEIHRCLTPGGRLIVMVYHRNSLHYRVSLRVKSLVAGMSLQQAVNEFDGVGNPKGDVYSRAELAEALSAFEALEMFAGYLHLPRTGLSLPTSSDAWLNRRFGWYLYARARKPG